MACYANLRLVGKWRVVDSSSAQLGAECSTPSASVEPAKSISGRRIDFLGYAIDVDQQLVVIAKKNVLKALDAYFQASIDGRRSLKVIEFQALASYAVRYRTICGLMVAPFMRALYVNIRGKNRQDVAGISSHLYSDAGFGQLWNGGY